MTSVSRGTLFRVFMMVVRATGRDGACDGDGRLYILSLRAMRSSLLSRRYSTAKDGLRLHPRGVRQGWPVRPTATARCPRRSPPRWLRVPDVMLPEDDDIK